MSTTTAVECCKLQPGHIAEGLREAGKTLSETHGAVVLDFSDVRRVAPEDLQALEKLAEQETPGSGSLTLRAVSVDVYKVLKLSRLASRFSLVD